LDTLQVRIPLDKESSKREVQGAQDEIQIFTDRSVADGKVGAAAILTRPGRDHRTLRLYLGKASKYTIYNAELAGLSMGMHLIKTKKVAQCSTMLGADNQAAINAIQNELSTPNHYIAKNILQTVQQISKTRGNKNYLLTIH